MNVWMRARRYLPTPAGVALLGAGATLLLLLSLWWQTGRWYQAQLVTERKAGAVEEVFLYGNALSSVISRRLARLQGLHAFVQTEAAEPDFAQKFEPFAAELYADTQGVRNLAVAPAGEVRYVYPLAGNEAVLGYRPADDPRPEVRADVARALETRAIIVSGPVELVQGGLGLIARQAVYRDDAYWGLVNVVLDLSALLAEAGVADARGDLSYALRDGTGRVFFGDADVFAQDPIINLIELPEGVWELGGVPAGGWAAVVQRPLRLFQGGGLIIVALLAGLVLLTINRQARLTQAVTARTQEIAQVNTLLEQRVAERTRELTALLDVSHTVVSTLELEPLLRLILTQLKTVVDYTGAGIIVPQDGDFVMLDYQGPVPRAQMLALRLPGDKIVGYREVMDRRQPLLIDDLWGETEMARHFQQTAGDALRPVLSYAHAWLGVPLLVRNKAIGLLRIDHKTPGTFTERDAQLALAFANQAAVAIENARLYEAAQRGAVLAERQRLARELHDSVSQALYGIALGARTARTLVERDPGRAQEPLTYVLSLAEGALTEMRALIFELRPESLAQEGLVAALARQTESLQARHGLAVHTEFADEPEVSLATKEALYRVAQEAMHNVAKHADARRVNVRLGKVDGTLTLEIRDDGKGFDPAGSFPGHLGLRSMQERMGQVGGELAVVSGPGRGTTIRAYIPT